jgi:hypothetical protein
VSYTAKLLSLSHSSCRKTKLPLIIFRQFKNATQI